MRSRRLLIGIGIAARAARRRGRRMGVRPRPARHDRRGRPRRRRRRRRDERRRRRARRCASSCWAACASRSSPPTTADASCCRPRRAGVAVERRRARSTRRVARSREGSFISRVAREVTGGSVTPRCSRAVVYSRLAVAHFVAQVGERLRPAAARRERRLLADLAGAGDRAGRRRRSRVAPLRRAIVHALTTADAPHTVARARAHGQAEGHDRPAGEEVPGRHHGRPRELQAAPVEGPEARQDLHDRRRPGRAGNAGRALRDPEQAGRPGLERAEQRLGGRPRRARRSRRARRTRSRRAGWASTPAPASTAPTRSARSARPPRTAASAWRCRT